MSTPTVVACRWDWCRSTFSTVDALETHVKHDHIWQMKPMQKAEIALMRKMDRQSLHSSLDSSIISQDLISGTSRANLPPGRRGLLDSDGLDTFARLSSHPQTKSPEKLPVSPAFESLMKHNGHAGLSVAVEMFERTRRNRSSRLPRSPMWRSPRSNSSGSSQAIEHQLTQEDDLSSQSLLAQELQIENELKPPLPADDATDASTSREIQNPELSQSQQSYRLCRTPDPARGQNLRCESLNVPLRLHSPGSSTNPEDISPESAVMSQPLMSQVNVSYSSQSQ